MVEQPEVGRRYLCLWDVPPQFQLDGKGRGAPGRDKSKPVADAEHVRVDRQSRFAEHDS